MKNSLVNFFKNFVIGAGIVFVIWYIAYVVIDRNVMPSPIIVLSRMYQLANHNIHIHLFSSFTRVALALAISMILGLFLGIISTHRYISKLMMPFLYFTYPIPRVALLPVVLLVFGLGDASTIIMICLIVIYPIIIVVRDTVKGIPRESYTGLVSLGASRMQIFRYVTLPWAFSAILSTLRISLGTAIAILFFTESYGTDHGMGFFILDMWMRLNYVMMFAGIVALSLFGFILFGIVDILEDVFLRWKKNL